MTSFKITFEECKQRAMLQTIPDYWVMLNGARFGKITFNCRGYIGYLPTKGGGKFDPGEVSLTAFKKAARMLEREENAMETAS